MFPISLASAFTLCQEPLIDHGWKNPTYHLPRKCTTPECKGSWGVFTAEKKLGKGRKSGTMADQLPTWKTDFKYVHSH